MEDVYVISAVRTPIGAMGGALANTPVAELGKIVIAEAVRRAGLAPDKVDEVIMGCVLSASQGQNVARQAALNAGIPVEKCALTVSMVCGSGMKAIHLAAADIKLGDCDIVVAGGMENMSMAPYAVPAARWGARMNHASLEDTMIKDGLWDVFNNYHMGITAENVAEKWGISREAQDEFALASQEKAADAIAKGRFADEIVPVPVKVKKETVEFATDEYPRKTSAEKLASLKPAFKKDGTVTAGNASGINDGAAAVVLASRKAVEAYGLKPMCRIISCAGAGVDPSVMGVAPIDASKNALEKAGLSVSDIDLIEANEAFAAQSLAVMKDAGFPPEKTNVNGGAIALGHPIGCSGARILVTLVHEMQKRDVHKGLATLCIGGGMGLAMIVER